MRRKRIQLVSAPQQRGESQAAHGPLASAWTLQLSISGVLLLHRSFTFRARSGNFFFPPPSSRRPQAPPHHTPGCGSFTERPVSYLIGAHLHLLNQRSHKWRESQSGQKKKKKRLHHPELLILNKTGDVLRKMQNNPSSSPTPLPPLLSLSTLSFMMSAVIKN